MKQNLFFAAIMATAVMTGCSKNEVHGNDSDSKSSNIEFASVIDKQTRATEMTTDALKIAGEIKMYNYSTDGAFSAATAFTTYFDANPETLSYSAASGWKTVKAYKWSALADKQLSIISIHPTLANAADYTAPTVSTAPKFAYTVNDDPWAQQDLIVSSSLNLTLDNTAGRINLKFKHILTQVLFKVQTDDANFRIKIKNLEVVGATNAATYTFLTTTPATAAEAIGSWGAATGDVTYKYVDGGTAIYNSIVAPVVGDAGALMILPQTANAALKFKITYDVIDAILDHEIITADVTKEAEMVTMSAGKKYAYTLIIPNEDADLIRFSVSVDDWEVPEIEHNRKFEVLTLNAANIVSKVVTYATSMAGKKSYIHTVLVNGAIVAPMTINMTSLALQPASGSKIILDLKDVTGISATNTITITPPATGWTLSTAVPLTASGIVTMTRN